MKKTLIAATLMMCAGSAFADSTAVLQVNGKLTNASCTPELSNGGVVDYGYVRLGTLSATAINPLDEKSIELTINCTAPTKVSWYTQDDRADSVPSSILKVKNASGSLVSLPKYLVFGLGQTKDGVNIGNYALLIAPNPTVDGKAGTLIYRNNDWGASKAWDDQVNTQRSDHFEQLTVASTGTVDPLAFTTATFTLKPHPTIQDTTTLAITDDTPLNGQATLTLHYL